MERRLFARNALLGAIEPSLRSDVNARLKIVDLSRGDMLYAPGDSVARVFFPLSGLVGIVADTADGEGMNTTIIGREGSIGMFEACGSRTFFAEAVVQVAGEAACLSARDYRGLFGKSEALRTAAHLYMERALGETRQAVICTSIHDVEARLCRILLQALERSGGEDVLRLTQATLAQMLGSRRTTLTEILSKLQRAGLVMKRRGAIFIDDRGGLEQLACSCRDIMRDTDSAILNSAKPACEAVLVAAE